MGPPSNCPAPSPKLNRYVPQKLNGYVPPPANWPTPSPKLNRYVLPRTARQFSPSIIYIGRIGLHRPLPISPWILIMQYFATFLQQFYKATDRPLRGVL